MSFIFKNEISIVLGGEAGLGIQTTEQVVACIVKKAGYCFFSVGEFMSRIRGGSNSSQIRISSRPLSSFLERIDLMIALDSQVLSHLGNRISAQTIIIGDKETISVDLRTIDVGFTRLAAEVGGKLFISSAAAGFIAGLLRIDFAIVTQGITGHFSDKDSEIISKNVTAANKGYNAGLQIANDGLIRIEIEKSSAGENSIFINGSEAVGIGAIAAGCNFVSSYPMSPSTGVLSYLAKNAHEFGIVLEQAEDEIAALNMVLGAWYAGARGLVTTSGGGFALMCEAVSLCGMIETPAVIHIGQRPGPATGLPTRTEQADLNLALYAGHGEFPRVLYAPGTTNEAYMLTIKAFNVADKYQVPVIILTDQFLLDSTFMTNPFEIDSSMVEHHVVESTSTYKRYAMTSSGVSPRAIPGRGQGIVCVDSDEHTEEGYITENAKIRVDMTDKRIRKLDLLRKEAIAPVLELNEDAEAIVVCWGSTCHAVREALQLAKKKDIALLHFSQVYPLHDSVQAVLKNYAKIILVEGNATGQFGKLIRQETGIDIQNRILRYDGSPFAADTLAQQIDNFF